MITLRQHLVSLIAVFLALGLGVVAGSTFVSPVTVKALSGSISTLDNRDKALEAQNNQLSATNNQLLQALAASRNVMVQGRLPGRPTDLISFDTTPAGETSDVATTLVEAGARLQSSVVLSSRLGLPDETSRQQVAAALGVTDTSTDALQAALVQRLADTLSGLAPGVEERLVSAGLASSNAVPDQLPLPAVAGPRSLVVILAPAVPQASVPPGPDLGRLLILPLVRLLTPTSAVVAVGEDGSSSLPVLSLLRGDSTLHVVTADGVDTPLGQAGLVLGLAQAVYTGDYGDYGLGAGSDGALPSPLPPAAPSAVPTPVASHVVSPVPSPAPSRSGSARSTPK